MNLQEQTNRIKKMMGIVIESTDKMRTNDGSVVLISDYVKNHIKEHNKFGSGSTFKEGITDDEILSYVSDVINSNELGEGGAFELEVPGIGYDLVLPYDVAINLDDVKETTTIKKEGKVDVVVPLIYTSQSSDDFTTDKLTLIIRKSDPQFLPDDVKQDSEILKLINQGKVYSLLTAYPGNPNIPKASKWDNQFAVVFPKKKEKIFNF